MTSKTSGRLRHYAAEAACGDNAGIGRAELVFNAGHEAFRHGGGTDHGSALYAFDRVFADSVSGRFERNACPAWKRVR